MRMRERCQLQGRLEQSLAEQYWQSHPTKLMRTLWDRLKQQEKAEVLAWIMVEDPAPAFGPGEAEAVEAQIFREAHRQAWRDVCQRGDGSAERLLAAWESAWPDERIRFLGCAGLRLDPGVRTRLAPEEVEWLARQSGVGGDTTAAGT